MVKVIKVHMHMCQYMCLIGTIWYQMDCGLQNGMENRMVGYVWLTLNVV